MLTAHEIRRSFGPVPALRGVSIAVLPGKITALVGDNGAGKSTLAKILCGADRADAGEMYLEGRRVSFRDPRDARARGIEAVFQDLALAPSLDVSTNLFLGREIRRGGRIKILRALDRDRMRERSREALADLKIPIPSLDVAVQKLSGGQRQAVAVARGLMWAHTVIILDEPTAALGVTETKAVLALIRRAKATGLGILFISHTLPEVLEVADSIVVLRHGKKVADLDAATATLDEIVRFITGAATEPVRTRST